MWLSFGLYKEKGVLVDSIKVDVIIPCYKPGKRFLELISMLEKQTVPVNHIYVINTEEKYFTGLVYGHQFENEHKKVSVNHISKMEFDHAATRRDGISKSDADYFVLMTDDALPKDEFLLEKLLLPLKEGTAQCSYARQLPNSDCGYIERFSRAFNYPKKSMVKSRKDLKRMGIKTFFFSDVCAAYDRKVYDELGGLVPYAIFNEDMLYAAKVIEADYSIAYVAEAMVYHSHNYSNSQQFHRNFDLGVSQAEHPEVFEKISSTGEGKKLVRLTIKHLKKHKKSYLIPKLVVSSAYKYLGYKMGYNYEKLPEKLVMKCTMNRDYWVKKNIRDAASKIDPHKGYGMSSSERK